MKNIILFLLLTTSISCSLLLHGRYGRVPLSISRQDCKPCALRIDGVYYNKRYAHFFLYSNGILSTGGGGFPNLSSLLKHSLDSVVRKDKLDTVFAWGIFQVDSSKVVIEQWVSSDDWGWERYQSSKYYGEVINDTTLFLSNYLTGPDTFRFYAMPVKPDSTNPFIK
jgi:hypothetical protein